MSELISNTKQNEELKIFQQHQIMDSYNILLNFYSQKECNNNAINFIEKINNLNKKFYSCSEKFNLTKASLENLSDELYLNLFKQIDCYVEEIQRLNKKLSTKENKDNKKEIKKLKKELIENKEKIKNYETKLKEKNVKEEKLLKELESYKRRIIFFKNKININLMVRNTMTNPIVNKYIIENNNNLNNLNNAILKRQSTKNFRSRSRAKSFFSKISKDRKFNSPSPERNETHNMIEGSINSSKNIIQYIPNSKDYKTKKSSFSRVFNNSLKNYKKKLSNDITEGPVKNIKTTTDESKLKELLSDGEADIKNKNKIIIKINRRIWPQDEHSFQIKKNYNKEDDKDINSYQNNCDINNNLNINENILENGITPKKYLKEELNHNKLEKKENKIIKRNKNEEKIIKNHPSTEIKCNNKKSRREKNMTIDLSNINLNSKKAPNTNKKTLPIKKIMDLTSNRTLKSNLKKKFFKCNTDTNQNINKEINNNPFNNNTLEDIKNNEIKNINNNSTDNNNIEEHSDIKLFKTKAVKFKNNEKVISESESNTHNDISSKDMSITNSFINKRIINMKNIMYKGNYTKRSISGNIPDNLTKRTITIDNSSNESNTFILKKGKKNISKKKLVNNNSFGNVINNQFGYKTKINLNKNSKESEQEKNENKLIKLVKEMNEDYNDDIEMLGIQEEQIKLMLNLIDLSDN